MRICVCAYDFPPVGGGRSYRMATYASHWASLGHRVTVVSAGIDPWNADNPDHEQAEILAAQVDLFAVASPFSSLLWRWVGSGFVGKWLRRLRGITAVPDLGRLWASCAVKALDSNHGTLWPFDWIVTSGPPHGVHAVGLKAQDRGVHWAADFRDPLTDNRNYRPKSSWHERADARFEKKVMEWADLLVANTDGNLTTLTNHYPAVSNRVFHVPNGFDPRDLPKGNRQRLSARRFRIVYLGTIRDYSQALRFFELFLDRYSEAAKHIELVHIGTRPFEGEVADRMRMSNQLRYVGFLPRLEALAMLDDFEMGLVILPREREAARTVPGKAYQYLGHNLPVLSVAPEGDLLEITREANGIAVDCEHLYTGAKELSCAIDVWSAGSWPGRYTVNSGFVEKFRNDRLAAIWAERMVNISGVSGTCRCPEANEKVTELSRSVGDR